MKAIIWGYEYDDMRLSWRKQMCWLVNTLLKNNVEVKFKDLKCKGIELPEYNCKTDNPSDIGIYNHTDISSLIGNVLKTKVNWFFKPTVPDEVHTTLDELGYGPFSSISFDKPDFESCSKEDVDKFFNTKVKYWVDKSSTKWGSFNKEEEVPYNDYWLILGQVGMDAVNVRHDFGDYYTKLKQIVKELVRIDNREIIIKLHPYTDGVDKKGNLYKPFKTSKDTNYSLLIKNQLENISPKVKVYRGKLKIHNFIKKCRAVILGNSGAGIEAMMHHKPIIAWGKPEYHWTSYDLRYLVDLIRAIKLDWFNREKQDKWLYWYLEKYCFYNKKTCNRRVEELLNNVRSR